MEEKRKEKKKKSKKIGSWCYFLLLIIISVKKRSNRDSVMSLTKKFDLWSENSLKLTGENAFFLKK